MSHAVVLTSPGSISRSINVPRNHVLNVSARVGALQHRRPSVTACAAEPACAHPVAQPSTPEEIDYILASLQQKGAEWHVLPKQEKIALLKEIRLRSIKCCTEMGRSAAKRFGYSDPNDPEDVQQDMANQQAIILGPIYASLMTSHIETLTYLDLEGQNEKLTVTRETADGRMVTSAGAPPDADVLLKGAETFLYSKPECEFTQGLEYSEAHLAAREGPAVVLGGGNAPQLAVHDLMHMLMQENYAVLLKYHPLQAETARVIEYVLEPLAERGYYKGVLLDDSLAQAAVYNDLTAAVHMTGGLPTFERLLWGPGAEGAKRKEAGEPLLKVPFTGELGNMTPMFMTPGEWTAAELLGAAQTIAFGTTLNAGCNCMSAKAIVMSAEWPQADEFEKVLKDVFRNSLPAPCWYPGAVERHAEFVAAHADCELVQSNIPEGRTYSAPVLPWAFASATVATADEVKAVKGIADEFFAPAIVLLRVSASLPVASAAAAPAAATGEPLSSGAPGGVALAEATEVAAEPAENKVTSPVVTDDIVEVADRFLQQMPGFADEYCFGNLACGVYIPDAIAKARPESADFCVDNLKYGAVALNGTPLVAYVNLKGVWGAFNSPEFDITKVTSGVGQTHNSFHVDNVEKHVYAFPWGHKISAEGTDKLPTGIVKPIVGLMGNGFQGLWDVINPFQKTMAVLVVGMLLLGASQIVGKPVVGLVGGVATHVMSVLGG